MMASRYLVITNISAKDLKAHDVRLFISLSGDESSQKQCTPVHKKGSNDPWLGHTFEFIVRDLDTSVHFKFVKNTLGFKRVVGEVDVPVMVLLSPVWDLLENGCVGHMKPKVLSREVTSSSPKTKEKTMGVLEFSYKFGELFPVKAPLELEEETVAPIPVTAAPPESYTPPMPRPLMAYQQNAAPPPAMNTGETVMGYAAYQQNAAPPPALNTGETVMGYAVGAYPPSTPRPQTAYQHDWAAYPSPLPAPHHQTAYLPYATPTYFYGAKGGYGPAAPPALHPGGNFLGRLGSGVAVSMIMSGFNNLGFDVGDFADAWF
ncbi:uncharacterized protein J3R85_014588 [Psidium guajava]|nr:uncharacterized protein J3R85_014588 [Psidium guajava]